MEQRRLSIHHGLSGHMLAGPFPDIRGLWMYCWLFDGTNSGTAIAKPTTSCVIWSAVISCCFKTVGSLQRGRCFIVHCYRTGLNQRPAGSTVSLKMPRCKGQRSDEEPPRDSFRKRLVFSVVVWLKNCRLRKWVTRWKGASLTLGILP